MPDSGKTYYSQTGEDILIEHIFTYTTPRSAPALYVDIGAFHPWRYSNTALLYLKGWRGINIDANPDSIAEFKRERPDDISLVAGVGPKGRKGRFSCLRKAH